MRILIVTDTADYGEEASLYPMVRALSGLPGIECVMVADRAISGNELFFSAKDAEGRLIRVRDANADFTFASQDRYPVRTITARDVDAVWLRLDLAPHEFLSYVQRLWRGRFISNRPSGIVRTASKNFLLSLQAELGDLVPRMALCQNVANVREFRAHGADIVLKVLHSFGGKGVARIRTTSETDLRGDDAIAAFLAQNGPCLAMDYLDHPAQSDNRLIVSNGSILGVLARRPAPGGWLCNLLAGGSYAATAADARELDMVRRVDPAMRRLGIHFYGVDTLMNAAGERVLSEINTMNPGCAWRYELATGIPVCRRIAEDFAANAQTARAGEPAIRSVER